MFHFQDVESLHGDRIDTHHTALLELMTFLVAPLEAVVRPRDVLMWTSTSKQLRVNSRPTVDRLLQRLSHASLLKEHLATIHKPFRDRHRASSVAPRAVTAKMPHRDDPCVQ